MSKNKITRLNDSTKNFFQCLVILVEFGGVSCAFAYFTSLAVPCKTVIDYLERGILGLALYEFIIFVILESINDGRKDSLIALRTIYSQAILACEEDSEYIFTEVNEYIKKQLEPDMLNAVDIRKEYETLQKLMVQKNVLALKYRQTLVDQHCNATDLKWKFTLLLRLFKEKKKD